MTHNFKNLIKVILIAVLAITTSTTSAQKHMNSPKSQFKQKEHFSSEQLASLKSKKMTLRLNLDKSQQKAVYDVTLNNIKKYKRQKKLRKMALKEGNQATYLDVFNHLNNRLNNQIALQRNFRRILNDRQFMQWRKRRFIKERRFNTLKKYRHNRRFIN